jgi:SAM-dependent methyltransferase
MAESDAIPAYQDALGAFHEAFADELKGMVAGLPIRPGDRVLDLACGDGRFSGWLADRVGSSGMVLAVDLLPSYLELARETIGREGSGGDRVGFVAADAFRPPLADGTFDLAWCAQSLRSLPDAVGLLRGMARLVRPGGAVAVLEEDAMHHLILPWPEDLELAVRQAELEALADSIRRPRSYYAGRRLPRIAAEAGLVGVAAWTTAIDRRAPLSDAERAFIDLELAALRDRAADRLDPDMLAVFDRLTLPGSDAYLPGLPDFSMTCIERLVVGTVP